MVCRGITTLVDATMCVLISRALVRYNISRVFQIRSGCNELCNEVRVGRICHSSQDVVIWRQSVQKKQRCEVSVNFSSF